MIITEHLETRSHLRKDDEQEQLLMCVLGPGGTGKSQLKKGVPEKEIQCEVGRSLWLQINTCVELTQQMRTEDETFHALLGRLRRGECTDADYELLQTRVVGGGEVESLNTIDWKQASIFIHPGMPVLLTDNIATELGSSNGSSGTSLVYTEPTDDEDKTINEKQSSSSVGLAQRKRFTPNTVTLKYPVYAPIEIQKSKIKSALEPLPEKLVPIPTVKKTFKVDVKDLLSPSQVKKAGNKTKIKVTRQQLPFVPAYSLTTHKSKGQTIPKIVIDLVPGTRPNVALTYVPLSRVKRLRDLVILRPFLKSVLQIKPNQEQTKELQRLDELNKLTKQRYDAFKLLRVI
ncbi:unnamed protein product [Didymodactylos carnosus]|uniref:ATP-dependent DNA helicase n=1 Tax=Didymodactylos carnosus TaxID=1234261 RepID=A0A814U916_9BILA|nr:unnamed protein product [Didymodactylos carnosus]CAF3937220.1 unnamed protein product [Didymodactylos carnosus]